MLKAVIFDLNGLFVKSEEYLSTRLERDFNIKRETFIPILEQVLGKARESNMEDSWHLWEPELKKQNLKFTKDEFWDYWFKHEQEDPEMLKLARELIDKGIKIFILSNNFRERAKYYKEHFSFAHLNDIADKIYFSFETGFIKPDPRAYQNVLNENNLKPDECIYFDNSQKNVAAAKKLGIKSYLFENPTQTKQIIIQILK